MEVQPFPFLPLLHNSLYKQNRDKPNTCFTSYCRDHIDIVCWIVKCCVLASICPSPETPRERHVCCGSLPPMLRPTANLQVMVLSGKKLRALGSESILPILEMVTELAMRRWLVILQGLVWGQFSFSSYSLSVFLSLSLLLFIPMSKCCLFLAAFPFCSGADPK